MKSKYFKIYIFILYFISQSIFAISQTTSIDDIPWSLKKYLRGVVQFTNPSRDFDQIKANNNYKILTQNRDYNLNRIKTVSNNTKIIAEGYFDAINKIPIVSLFSPLTAMVKESVYQIAGDVTDENLRRVKGNYDNSIIELFEKNMRKSVIENNTINYTATVERFKEELQTFKNNTNPADYQLVSSRVDDYTLHLISQRSNYFENKLVNIRSEVESDRRAGIINLENAKNEFAASLKGVASESRIIDKAILEKLKNTNDKFNQFSQKVIDKIELQQTDINSMKDEISANDRRISENSRQITILKSQQIRTATEIISLNEKTQENRKLINENSFKIDVISDVLYNNVSTYDKIKLLELKYLNNQNDRSFIRERTRLNNISYAENLRGKIEIGREVVTLATNLGLNPQDAQSVSKAFKYGEVLLNGFMAVSNPNPLAGLQAINSAFGLFNNGSRNNPEFEATMEQFNIVNKRFDTVLLKIDNITRNIDNLKEATFSLHEINQRRFDVIEERLDKIQYDLNSISRSLNIPVIGFPDPDYDYLWDTLKNQSSIEELRRLYNENPRLRRCVSILYNNTENSSLDTKPLLHFKNFDSNNYWEYDLFMPLIRFADVIFSGNSINRLSKYYLSYLYENDLFDGFNQNMSNYFDSLVGDTPDNEIKETLIYPQSIVSVTKFMNLFEPYYYFSSSNQNDNFSIPDSNTISTLNYSIKNRNLLIQYKNILKENRTAIIQTNILAGLPFLNYFKRHIQEPTFKVEEKTEFYKILNSSNYYLKVNLANSILSEFVRNSDNYKEYLVKILSSNNINTDSVDTLIELFNQGFSNNWYYIKKIQNSDIFEVVLAIRPMNIQNVEQSRHEVHLPLPILDYIIQNKLTYPSYINDLHSNQEILMNKILKFQIIEDMNKKGLFDLKHIN